MRRSLRTSRMGVVAVLTTAVLSIAACSSGSGDGGGSSGGSMSIKLGQISNSVAFFPIYVAQQKGYFKDQHVSVSSPTLLGTGAKLAAALVSGSIDIGGGVMTDAFNLANTHKGGKVVSNLVNDFYVDMIVGKDFQQPGSGASLMQKVKALKGKKIGITGPGSGTEALVKYLFAKAGMNPATDATLVNLGAQATAVLGALKTGKVDALSFFQPIGQEVEAQGLGSIYISPARGDVPSMEHQVHGVAIASGQALSEKPDAVSAFVHAIGQAEQFIHSNTGADKTLLAKYESTLDSKTVASVVPVLQEEIPTSPAVSRKGYQVAVNFHKTAGLVTQAPSYSSLIASSLISKATQ